MKNNTAIIVLPAGMGGRIRDPQLLRWLSRGQLSADTQPQEALSRVLRLIDGQAAAPAFAALRYWGQRGQPPQGWLAAVEAVHFETRLRDLCIRSLPPDTISTEDMASIFTDFRKAVGEGLDYHFEALGNCGYIRGKRSFATALHSAQHVDGRVPDTLSIPASVTRDRLLSELEMFLHEHPVNQQRAGAGLPAVNSFWFWGAGEAPTEVARELPVLYGDDALFRGHWLASQADAKDWPGDLSACLGRSEKPLVAQTPAVDSRDSDEVLAGYLSALRQHLSRGDISQLTLVFRDGLIAYISRTDRMRVWRRRISPLLLSDILDE